MDSAKIAATAPLYTKFLAISLRLNEEPVAAAIECINSIGTAAFDRRLGQELGAAQSPVVGGWWLSSARCEM